MAKIEEERFEERLAAYMAKHTGVKLSKLKPGPPVD